MARVDHEARRTARAARDEARPFLGIAKRDPAFAQLEAWLAGPDPTRRVECEDPRRRMGLSFAMASSARRAGFEVILLPLGPDLWRARDIMDFLGRRLSAEVQVTATRYREQRLAEALADRPDEQPLLIIADGLEDADPRMPWDLLSRAARPAVRVLFASAGSLDTSPAGSTVVDLLACSVGALSRAEIRAALGASPRFGGCASWIREEDGLYTLHRALRGAALARWSV